MGFFQNLKNKLTGNNETNEYLDILKKSSASFGNQIDSIVSKKIENVDSFLDALLETLLASDLGYETSEKICQLIKPKLNSNLTSEELTGLIIKTLQDIYNNIENCDIVLNNNGPTVYLMIGVNGSGKTTTIAKMAYKFKNDGLKVLLVAADTFRAGAVEQLKSWATRLNVDIICGKENQDPSSVLVDGCRYGRDNNFDVILCDTAGRLQTKINLMNELEKMYKVISREISGAPHNTWLVIDSNTGQNGLSQALLFSGVTFLNGIVLTKVDGTSKGGIVFAIKDKLGIPVRYIGYGENLEDLKLFDLDMYLFGLIGDKHYE